MDESNYAKLYLDGDIIYVWKHTKYLDLSHRKDLKHFPDLKELKNLEYVKINPNVKWNTYMYPHLTTDTQKRIFTLLLMHKYGPLNKLPLEIIHIIINNLTLQMSTIVSETCIICRQGHICIEHTIDEPIDDELCKYVGSINCEHTYHQCCINRWLKTRYVCPICLKIWENK